ncbi:four helix bundle protein [uncultured Legionella sp.]|uniref:four helix bundle protein n=1 Tax=uncultured Legionella sp. TaxID=210934 RepID=UPI002631F738|nr:four helix bundle protein [uncultured Legionella sp.]
MALYYDLPVYRDTYAMLLKLFQFTKEFPREYKYSLADNMRRDALQLVRSIYRANKSESKRAELELFMDNFELLKLEIRLCVDMKLLPIRQQAVLSELMERIGRQITGWHKASA